MRRHRPASVICMHTAKVSPRIMARRINGYALLLTKISRPLSMTLATCMLKATAFRVIIRRLWSGISWRPSRDTRRPNIISAWRMNEV
jgi:hypothetical protein